MVSNRHPVPCGNVLVAESLTRHSSAEIISSDNSVKKLMFWTFLMVYYWCSLPSHAGPTEVLRMSSPTQLSPVMVPMVPIFPSSTPAGYVEPNATSCQQWEQPHHLFFHLGNLSLLLGLVLPTTLGLHMILLRLFLMTGLTTDPRPPLAFLR